MKKIFKEYSIIQHKQSGKYKYLLRYNSFLDEWDTWNYSSLSHKTLERWYNPVPYSNFKNSELLEFVIKQGPCPEAFLWLLQNSWMWPYLLWQKCPDGLWLEFVLLSLGIHSQVQQPDMLDPHFEKTLAKNIRRQIPWNRVKKALAIKMKGL